MGRTILEFTKNHSISIQVSLLVSLVLGVFYAGGQFYSLRRKIEENWSYRMERDVWRDFQALNQDQYPNLKIPDVLAIRRDNIYSILDSAPPYTVTQK